MRGGRPVMVLLAAASMAVAGMGVHLGVSPVVDEDFPPRRRRIAPTRGYRSGGRYPHQGEHEIARRLRQQSRDAERQRARLDALGGDMRGRPHPRVFGWQVVGVSRRGSYLWAPRDMSALAAL